MGYAKCMEDNEELWSENNFFTGNSSIYGFRDTPDLFAGYTRQPSQIQNYRSEVKEYGRVGC